MAPETALVLVFGILGALLGSFLNVCIIRWGAEPKQSVVRPRSRCPNCGYQLAWYDNVPMFSWMVLGGKCRKCRTPISIQYPLIELATALIWAANAWHNPGLLDAVQWSVFHTILLGIAMTDARQYVIPDEFTIGGLVLALLFSVAGGFDAIVQSLLGAAAGFALLWAVGSAGTWMFKEEAMGGGDVKMMAMVGAFLGWKGVLLTVFLGALLGTIIFLPLSLLGKKKLVPFGVFLAVGAAATQIAGPAIIGWYQAYLGGA